MDIKDVVIIGAGPAGISAAIQLKRYDIEPVLFEQDIIGGLLKIANLVENYPGFPSGITGIKLAELFKKQIESAQIKVNFDKVLKLEYNDELFLIKTERNEIHCRFVIIASGTKPKSLTAVNILAETEKYLFYEVYPLRNVADKKIAIIGAGDAAFDYALNLSKKNEVIILNRSEKVKCIPLLRERAYRNKNISYLQNLIVKRIIPGNDGLILTCSNNAKEYEMNVSYLVIAAGRQPCLDFISTKIINDLERFLHSKKLFIIGDVKIDIYRQTAIAAGDGIRAAMEISRKIKMENL